jgi:hypothetical protein
MCGIDLASEAAACAPNRIARKCNSSMHVSDDSALINAIAPASVDLKLERLSSSNLVTVRNERARAALAEVVALLQQI